MVSSKRLYVYALEVLLLTSGMAWAGSNSARLACISESGKVELKGEIPATEEALDLTLNYNGIALRIDFSESADGITANVDVTAKFRKGIFKLNVLRPNGDDLFLEALPKTIVIHTLTSGSTSAEFDATLIGPRPGGEKKADGTSVKPLRAVVKCRYEYSI